VCIYVSNELLSDNEVIPIVTNTPGIESLFLQVHNQSWNFILGCVYRPPSSNINDDCTLLDVLGELTTRHGKVFVFGDLICLTFLGPGTRDTVEAHPLN
jgi:hypothetical protein